MDHDTTALVQQLRNALHLAIKQNSHDMLMTGEEIRQCELEKAAADHWLAEQPAQSVAQPPTDEWLLDSAGATLYMHNRPAVDRLVRACADAWGVTLADGIGQPARDTKPCRCGPDGCADSACPGRTSCATT